MGPAARRARSRGGERGGRVPARRRGLGHLTPEELAALWAGGDPDATSEQARKYAAEMTVHSSVSDQDGQLSEGRHRGGRRRSDSDAAADEEDDDDGEDSRRRRRRLVAPARPPSPARRARTLPCAPSHYLSAAARTAPLRDAAAARRALVSACEDEEVSPHAQEYRAMDIDGNGDLTADEMAAQWGKEGRDYQKRVDWADADGDGKVSEDEWVAATSAKREGGKGGWREGRPRRIAARRRRGHRRRPLPL